MSPCTMPKRMQYHVLPTYHLGTFNTFRNKALHEKKKKKDERTKAN